MSQPQDESIRKGISRALENQLFEYDKFIERFSETAAVKIKIPVVQPAPKPPKAKDRPELNLLLSDTHFGALLKYDKPMRSYGPNEEARRLAYVVQAAAETCVKQKVRKLNLLLGGDIINGRLHDDQSSAAIVDQVAAATHYLAQAITYLIPHVPQIEVVCVTGNHGRRPDRHVSRGVHHKWDSYETLVYKALQGAFSNHESVTFRIPKAPHATYESHGHGVFLTHGDTIFSKGVVGKSINLTTIEAVVNKLNTLGGAHSVFCYGHVHIGSLVNLANGVGVIANGTLMGTDPFGLSISSPHLSPGQTLWLTTPDDAIASYKFVRPSAAVDSDDRYDKVIAPYNDYTLWGN